MRRIRIGILVVLCLSLAAGAVVRSFVPKVDETLFLPQISRGGTWGPKAGSPPHYASASGEVAFNSSDVVPSIRGYAGPVKAMVGLDREGRITGIKVMEHAETPNYVRHMLTPQYLAQYIGKGVNDPIELERDIDGITRATVSARALADTVRESSRMVASGALGIQSGRSDSDHRLTHGYVPAGAYLVLFGVAAALYIISRRRHSRAITGWGRDMALAAAIGIVGLWLSSPFSVLHMLNLFMLRPSVDPLWIAVVGSTIMALAFMGRFYCGWLCPFGALSEFISRLPMRKWEITPDIDARWRKTKYIIFGVVIAFVLISGRTEFGNIETYVTLFSFSGNRITWLIVGVSLAGSLVVPRMWCRFLCPVAALSGILSRPAGGYPSTRKCPMANPPSPDMSECIRCNKCTS